MKFLAKLVVVSAISVCLYSLSVGSVSAVSASELRNQYATVRREIIDEIDNYLVLKNKNNVQSLTQDELSQLVFRLNDIKTQHWNVYVVYDNYLRQNRNNRNDWSWAGDAFVTVDQGSVPGFNHGHAAIASRNVHATIEALAGGIQKIWDGNQRWDHKRCRAKYHGVAGGVYRIVGLNNNQRALASDYASWQLGKGYDVLFWTWDDTLFYCSELVYKAWRHAGKTMNYSNPLWGHMVLPADIMLSPDTYLIEDWLSWNNNNYPNGNSCLNP